MKTRAEIIADRLDEMGRIKDMGRPAILDTEREAAEIIRFMQRRIAELEKENASLEKGAEQYEAWYSIMEEVDRRAYKEHCLEDKCDFTVTVTYEEYLATCTSTLKEFDA